MRWLRHLFGRERRPPLLDRRERDARWEIGDQAVCINGDWIEPHSPDAPPKGACLTVDGIGEWTHFHQGVGLNVRAVWLCFIGREGYFESAAFRKLIPDTAPAEAEFSEFIKRPVRVPETVRAG